MSWKKEKLSFFIFGFLANGFLNSSENKMASAAAAVSES